jgi:hypothetical protein
LALSEIDRIGNKDNNDSEFSDKIIILKKVKSLRQLRRTEKELVKLIYKEAIIKGFTLKGIQQYIASKTKIWIEWSCLEYLKKAEEQENREWYYYMAKDHFAYVGAYRKCIDEIEQYKREIWKIIMDSKTTHETKIQAFKELHNLSKTYTLLIKDLPFITNLSKYYDKDILKSNYSHDDSSYYNKNNQGSRKNQFYFNYAEDEKTLLDHSGLKDDNKDSGNYKHIDDEVMEDMQSQIPNSDTANGKNQEGMTDKNLNKLITPERRVTIRKLRELLDD